MKQDKILSRFSSRENPENPREKLLKLLLALLKKIIFDIVFAFAADIIANISRKKTEELQSPNFLIVAKMLLSHTIQNEVSLKSDTGGLDWRKFLAGRFRGETTSSDNPKDAYSEEVICLERHLESSDFGRPWLLVSFPSVGPFRWKEAIGFARAMEWKAATLENCLLNQDALVASTSPMQFIVVSGSIVRLVMVAGEPRRFVVCLNRLDSLSDKDKADWLGGKKEKGVHFVWDHESAPCYFGGNAVFLFQGDKSGGGGFSTLSRGIKRLLFG